MGASAQLATWWRSRCSFAERAEQPETGHVDELQWKAWSSSALKARSSCGVDAVEPKIAGRLGGISGSLPALDHAGGGGGAMGAGAVDGSGDLAWPPLLMRAVTALRRASGPAM